MNVAGIQEVVEVASLSSDESEAEETHSQGGRAAEMERQGGRLHDWMPPIDGQV